MPVSHPAADDESRRHDHPGSDDSPWTQLRQTSPRAFGRQFARDFADDDVPGLAAEIAYHLIFAIPPVLILVITVAAILNEFTSIPVADTLKDLVAEQAPESAQDVLTTIITNAVEQVDGGLLSIGLVLTTLLALWSASNGMAALMKAFNRAYEVTEDRSFIRKKLVAIGLTLVMAIFVNVALVLWVFSEPTGAWIADWIGLGDAFTLVWNIARWPAAILMFIVVLALLYHWAPNVTRTYRWLSPGAVVATVLWFLVLYGFKLYLQFSDPGSAYGVFGGAIVFLFFLYMSGIVLLIGAEVNAVLHKQGTMALTAPQDRRDPAVAANPSTDHAMQPPTRQPPGRERGATTPVSGLPRRRSSGG